MEKFSLEKWGSGAKICTSDGREVNIAAYNTDANYCFVGWHRDTNGAWLCGCWDKNGVFYAGRSPESDLVMAPITKYLNVYTKRNGTMESGAQIYNSEPEAQATGIECISFEFLNRVSFKTISFEI